MEEKDFRESQRELLNSSEKAHELYRSINIESFKKQLSELEKETHKDDFWKDKDRYAVVNRDISMLKKKIEPWDSLISEVDETVELMEMALSEMDVDLLNDICTTISDIEKKLEDLETHELLSEEDDVKDAFISIHPGAFFGQTSSPVSRVVLDSSSGSRCLSQLSGTFSPISSLISQSLVNSSHHSISGSSRHLNLLVYESSNKSLKDASLTILFSLSSREIFFYIE